MTAGNFLQKDQRVHKLYIRSRLHYNYESVTTESKEKLNSLDIEGKAVPAGENLLTALQRHPRAGK